MNNICSSCNTPLPLWMNNCPSCAYDMDNELTELEMRLEHIEEKLLTNMTPRQTADWEYLRCRTSNQVHKLRWEIMKDMYDQDDLNKMALRR